MTVPFAYQLDSVDKIEQFGGKCLLAMSMGLGKAQPLDAKILTPTGWTTMRDVSIGDTLIGSSGGPIKVTGVFPQGTKDIYQIEFTDRTHTECCQDHLWAVSTPYMRTVKSPPNILTLDEIQKKGLVDNVGNRRHFIPLVEPVKFTENELPIHPYLLGYILANGNITHGGVSISTPDREMIDRLSVLIPTELSIKHSSNINYNISKIGGKHAKGGPNALTNHLRDLGLMGRHSYSKFIPSNYLYSSLASRILLFQGLMDGDGYVSKDNSLSYSSTSQNIANGVRELVQSFGGTAKLYLYPTPKFTYKGEIRTGRPCYDMTIALPEHTKPFQLSRKANRYHPRTKYPPCRAIKTINYVGKKDCQCIAVDAPDSLYVTDHYLLTHNSLTVLLWIQRHPEIKKVIVVCPASIKWVWEREAAIHVGIRAEILEGRKIPKGGFPNNNRLTVINYDILPNWVDYLKTTKPQLIVGDEVQYSSTPNAKRSKAFRKLCKGVKHVIGLSGTPLTNRPSELWHPIHVIRPDLFPNFRTYAERYCNPRKTFWGWDYSGASNLEELNKTLLANLMTRVRKSDVLSQLPPMARHIVPLEIENRKEYNSAVLDFLGWLREISPEKAQRAARAEKMARIGYIKRLSAKLKIKSTIGWIDNFLEGSDEKLILFGIHKEVIDPLQDRYKDQCVVVTGSVTGRQREKAFDQFLNCSSTKLFIGNVRAAGVGWSAKGVSTVAFAEMDWSPSVMQQAEDRTHGIGRGQEGIRSQSYWLVARNTIEETLCQVLQKKQKILTSVLDGGDADTGLDVYDQLEEALRDNRPNK